MVFFERLFVLIGLSVVIGTGYLAWLASTPLTGGHDGAIFARHFLSDLSRSSWDVRAVSDRLKVVDRSEEIAAYGRLGEFQYLTDFSERDYLVTPMRGITAYAFNGRFRNGKAMVQMLVRRSPAGIEVSGLYVTPIGRIEPGDAPQVSALDADEPPR